MNNKQCSDITTSKQQFIESFIKKIKTTEKNPQKSITLEMQI